jgi:hypothetical protein
MALWADRHRQDDILGAGAPRYRVHARLACESSQPDEPPEHAKLACDWQAGVSLLGCQLRRPNSLVEGAMWAAGRSLPDMSLAFALMAAINGSTGSCATLSHGL